MNLNKSIIEGFNLVYHYAPWAYLRSIVESGALRPGNPRAENERAMLWFRPTRTGNRQPQSSLLPKRVRAD